MKANQDRAHVPPLQIHKSPKSSTKFPAAPHGLTINQTPNPKSPPPSVKPSITTSQQFTSPFSHHSLATITTSIQHKNHQIYHYSQHPAMAAMQINAKLSRLLVIFNSHEFCNHHRSITASQSHSSQALPPFNQRRHARHTAAHHRSQPSRGSHPTRAAGFQIRLHSSSDQPPHRELHWTAPRAAAPHRRDYLQAASDPRSARAVLRSPIHRRHHRAQSSFLRVPIHVEPMLAFATPSLASPDRVLSRTATTITTATGVDPFHGSTSLTEERKKEKTGKGDQHEE
ncbi:hypothetical protein M0R45_007972 [Rubus argutus]|uniref:Uncharacterized protein n=1 Tax=Rubus argutus TaxID=59490 RepID=A0AAW1Y2A6_RUBAR